MYTFAHPQLLGRVPPDVVEHDEQDAFSVARSHFPDEALQGHGERLRVDGLSGLRTREGVTGRSTRNADGG